LIAQDYISLQERIQYAPTDLLQIIDGRKKLFTFAYTTLKLFNLFSKILLDRAFLFNARLLTQTYPAL
jgi:hypothetical protein